MLYSLLLLLCLRSLPLSERLPTTTAATPVTKMAAGSTTIATTAGISTLTVNDAAPAIAGGEPANANTTPMIADRDRAIAGILMALTMRNPSFTSAM